MTGTVIFDPLIPWPVLIAIAGLALGGTVLALWRGLSGWALRGLAVAVIVAALSGPVYQVEDRAPLTDIVLMIEDESASQTLSDRAEQTALAAEALADAILTRDNTELRRIRVGDGEGDEGTQVMTALNTALAEEPRARIAGILVISDGIVHDADQAPELPAPMHLLQTGRAADWDRRLIVRNAPAFAIIGEPVTLTLRIEDSGAAPVSAASAPLEISVGGGAPQQVTIPGRRGCRIAGHPAAWRAQCHPVLGARSPGRADRSQQHGLDPDERGPRPAAGAACLGRTASRRADLAQPVEIGQFGRSGAFHHPAPARKAGWRAG